MDARRLADAFEFAFKAHDGVTRKQSFMPYITHPMEAAFIVSSVPGISDEAVIAAILHDVVEDTEYTADDIEKHFGKKIRELVASESEDKMVHLPKEESWKLRKEAFLNHYLTLRGPDIWNKFNMKDVSLQKWYYESVLDSLKELDSLPAYKELEECVKFVFKDHINK